MWQKTKVEKLVKRNYRNNLRGCWKIWVSVFAIDSWEIPEYQRVIDTFSLATESGLIINLATKAPGHEDYHKICGLRF